MIDLYNETDIEVSDEYINKIMEVAESTLKFENFPFDADIAITIVDNSEIKFLNNKYREKNVETDVLSFPGFNITPQNFTILENEQMPINLGDIVISIEKAITQSEEYNHSLLRELTFLTVHSVLHLLGYDHENGETTMFEKQEQILNGAGILR